MKIKTKLVYMGIRDLVKGENKYTLIDLYDDEKSYNYSLFINNEQKKKYDQYKKFNEYDFDLSLYTYRNKAGQYELRLGVL